MASWLCIRLLDDLKKPLFPQQICVSLICTNDAIIANIKKDPPSKKKTQQKKNNNKNKTKTKKKTPKKQNKRPPTCPWKNSEQNQKKTIKHTKTNQTALIIFFFTQHLIVSKR